MNGLPALMVSGRQDFSRRPTVVGHVAVAPLEHQVDAVAPPADLLHRLAVGHPSRAVAIDLHQLVADLQPHGPVERLCWFRPLKYALIYCLLGINFF